MISVYKHKSNIAAGVCLTSLAGMLFLMPGGYFSYELEKFSPIFSLIFVPSYFCFFWFYIKSKGRSGWWMLLLFLNVVGLIIIFRLDDKTKDAQTT